ncbi:MAG: PKD domain-containing protein [Candidatus Sericytochromatia bacterium]|nr:PKD domain-containing protein [Candidatus Tanganyikabacteria bacterium]
MLSAKVEGGTDGDSYEWSVTGGSLSSRSGVTVTWTPPTQAGPQIVTLVVTFKGGTRSAATLEFKVADGGTVYREKLNLTASVAPTVAPVQSPTPTPTPSPSPTLPAGKNALMIYSLSFETDVASRTITVINTGTASVNLNDYILSYEYEQADYQLKMQHMRFGKVLTLQSLGTLTVSQTAGCSDGKCVAVDASLGGTGASSLGIQVAKGSAVLYKGSVSDANAQDYLQYGAKAYYPWSHGSLAASSSIWSGTDSYAPAGVAGMKSRIKAVGSWGAANWQVL